MTDYFTKFVPSFEAVVEFHKANLDAFVQAQTAFFKGSQEISKEFVAQTQANLEALAVASKTALTAKTLQEVVELNVGGAKSHYETLVANSTKLGELGVQIANDAFAPIKARATVVTETLLKPVAA